MGLSQLAIRRPVLATVAALLLAVLGIATIFRLPVREYPDVEQPVVSVAVVYPGAAAAVVERDVTEVIEDNLSGIEDVELITSTTRDGFAQINVEFALSRDLDAAAADIRDRVSAVRLDLPDEVEEPVISKSAAESQAIMWITLISEERDRRALTDYAIRNLVDPLSIVSGVAQVVVGGERRYAMRIWLDTARMAARSVTVQDVAGALRRENIEPPGGRIETDAREISIRLATKLSNAREFRELVLRSGENEQVLLGDVARVELGAESYRSAVYRDGRPGSGLGIIRQSGANVLEVAGDVRAELDRLRERLPEDIELSVSYDQSEFIQSSIRGVLTTLVITAALVIAVIYLFIGTLRGTLVPAATIPTSLLGTFIILYALGFSINTLTLLALVLSIGLVVDDAIVVLENVVRLRQEGEKPFAAAVKGARQVGLAVVTTTAVLVAVILPISTITGTIGRLFTEFAVALSAALIFSSFLALTTGAVLALVAARGIDSSNGKVGPLRWFSRGLDWLESHYRRAADAIASASWIAALLVLVIGVGAWFLFNQLPSSLAPTEDRGAFIIPVQAPEGASLAQTSEVVRQIEEILNEYRGEGQPIAETISILGLSRQGSPQVNQATVIVTLRPWDEREMGQVELVTALTPRITALPGAEAVPINPSGIIAQSFGRPVQFVISGPDYDTAYNWAQAVKARVDEAGFMQGARIEFNREQPELSVEIRRRLAADLGLSVADIGEAMRILFAEQDITDFYRLGETYEVMVRARESDRDDPADLDSVFLRNAAGDLVPLAAVIETRMIGSAPSYRRVNRQPSIVISGVPATGTSIGTALQNLEQITADVAPNARTSTLGLSREFQQSAGATLIVFGMALVIVYLTLAALFESFVYPFVIMVAVPLAIAGGLAALVVSGASFNIFSQIALLLLIGLLAKNAVLVVDFANQRRREGRGLRDAVVDASSVRFRPILMTSVATFFGALPLLLATGAGSEARSLMGLTIMVGVALATLITLLVVPGLYVLLSRFAGVPGQRARAIEEELREPDDTKPSGQ